MLKAWDRTGIPSRDWMSEDGTPLWAGMKAQIKLVEEEFTRRGWPRSNSSILTTGLMLARGKAGEAGLGVVKTEYLYALVLLRCIERGVL
jgi:hypothetical protein